jgi:YidC/Oxa1 family membrane protein insertase
MNNDSNRNFMIALALCAAVLFGWQYFIATPQMKADQARQAQLAKQIKTVTPLTAPGVPGMATTTTHM